MMKYILGRKWTFIIFIITLFSNSFISSAQRIGDPMPFYDEAQSTYYIYYLEDVWDDATNERHPWHALTSVDLSSYTEIGEIIGCSTGTCDQDYALGTGSVIQKENTYYGFYTGHNPNSMYCTLQTREGIMLATSTDPGIAFQKRADFTTIYAPEGLGFDVNDNFRDPFVFVDNGTYYMLVSARKDHNSAWRGVIALYSSSDLMSWNYQGILYDGGADNFFMMECPDLFKNGDTYYLIFSNIDDKQVYYRKSISLNGPWNKPEGSEILNGVGYAAKTASNGTERHIFGWEMVGTTWAGDLLSNELKIAANGDLTVYNPNTAYITVTLDMSSYTGTGFSEVKMNGGFNGWGDAISLTNSEGNLWTATVPMTVGDTTDYRFELSGGEVGWTAEWEGASSTGDCFINPNDNTQSNMRWIEVTGDATLPTVCWESCSACVIEPTAGDITVSVDLSAYTGPSFTEVKMNGGFSNWSAYSLTNSEGNLWTATVPMEEGINDYRFELSGGEVGWTSEWEGETSTGDCFINPYDNTQSNMRRIDVDGDATLPTVCWESCNSCFANITVSLDMSSYPDQSFTEVKMNGGFSNWSAYNLTKNEGNIWTATVPMLIGATTDYRFEVDGPNGWASEWPNNDAVGDCFVNGNMRSITVTGDATLPTVCWESCTACPAEITVTLDLSAYTGPGFTEVKMNGGFNGWGEAFSLTNSKGNLWTATVPMNDGFNDYRFELSGGEVGWTAEWESETSTGDCFINPYDNTQSNMRWIEVDGDATLPTVCWESCTACPANITVTLDLSAYTGPGFTEVKMNGGFNGWGEAFSLTNSEGNLWTATVPMNEGFNDYRFELSGGEVGWTAEWESETSTGDCFVNPYDNTQSNMRWIEVDGDATLPTVCWESCSECIHDNTAPVITTCPASREVFLTGNCELNVPDLISEIVATDNYTSVEELTITQEPAAGTLLPSGEGTTHAVIVTVDDKNGNTATCEVTLTGDDNIAPEVITNPLTVYLDASGQASITAEDIDNGSHDACGTIGLSVDIDAFDCSNVGSNTVTLTVTDGNGNAASAASEVIVEDHVAPVVITQNLIVQLDATGIASITAADIDNSSSDACGIASMSVSPDAFTCEDSGENTVTLTVTDVNGNSASETATVTVENEAPVITALTGPEHPAELGSSVSLTIGYDDRNATNVNVQWDDGTESNYAASGSTVVADHTYTTPGVYSVSVIVSDACCLSDVEELKYVVIYDPNEGFVTGGGWIYSPAGAYKPDLSLTGKANFGFVSKYKKGANTPEGKTEFQFKAGNLNFNSSKYEYMVIIVAGAKSLIKGTGTINGEGNYGFILSALDADLTPSAENDRFRIKIWDIDNSDAIVYDNNIDGDDNADPATEISGGSITIHTTNTKSAELIIPEAENASLLVYPNPFADKVIFEFASPEETHTSIEIFDLSGRKIETVYDGLIMQNVKYDFYFTPVNKTPGVYLYRVTIGDEIRYGKVVHK